MIETYESGVTGQSRSAKAWVARGPKQRLEFDTVDLGPLGDDEVEIAVESCGLCHSDLSVLNNEWGISQYPAILGHEAVGRVTAIGSHALDVKVGQRVGIGWSSGSCMHCRQCMSGNHNLCPEGQFTIVGHRGGFASHMRAHWAWAIPLPEGLNVADAGPLLCGGVTVFSPLAMYAKHRQRPARLGCDGQRACAQWPPAHRRRGIGADSRFRILADHWTTQRVWLAHRLAGHIRNDA